ncbi:uroporphyrinogen-III C-methyltransferase [Alkalimarinus sediminis]|uniref:Uroporphyrinogen-III C-methyltransferase n=1 Tax=Alkalimarinus sediminis TaxID=1632866 RepID=A0A9E8HS03_9ALTE|nr:uroporphyrinogen-III C-methyltransferase [Alkalimarinus sediminis]UZW74714.1 uroporphyrinogen-III C-methyltransferase [Alkalimarinus sediminis]
MTNEKQPQLPVPVTPPSKVRLWPLWLVIIILITALVSLAAYGWLNIKEVEQLKFQLDYITKGDDSKSQTVQQLKSQVDKQNSDLLAQSRTVSDQLATLRRQTEHNARQLSQVGGQSRTDWLLAEAEYLMRLANQRLNMERDAAGAEAILNAANSVLAESDDPGLYAIRQQLSKDIIALQRVSKIDREGIYLQLEALIDLIAKLDQSHYQARHNEATAAANSSAEIAEEQSELVTSDGAFTHMLKDALDELKQLVVIRRLDEAVEPLLAPDQVYYLQQNLRLMIEQAELALLDRNQPMYQRNLTKAEQWINTYFSQNKDDTALLLSTLERLKALQIDPELPDISQSLQLLKKRVALLYRQHQLPTPSEAITPEQALPETKGTADGAVAQ